MLSINFFLYLLPSFLVISLGHRSLEQTSSCMMCDNVPFCVNTTCEPIPGNVKRKCFSTFRLLLSIILQILPLPSMFCDEGFFLFYKQKYIHRGLDKEGISLGFRNSFRVLASGSVCRLVGRC